MPAFVPVVICGGSGARLWPFSRSGAPKPFVTLPGRSQPLIDETYARLFGAELPPPTAVLSICAEPQRFLCAERYRLATGAGAAPHLLIGEPCAKNTAAAIAVAAELVRRRFGEDALIAVLPADHAIDGAAGWRRTLTRALTAASEGAMALLGIPPTYAATGFGYIECGAARGAAADGVAAVQRFVEKPAADAAQEFLRRGNFLWNGGTFCFRAADGLAQIAAHAPQVAAALPAVFAGESGADTFSPPPAAYAHFPEISFDYAVMEKTDCAAVVRAEGYEWSDVGTWRAIAAGIVADENGNRTQGDVLLHNSRDCFVAAAGGRLVSALGVSDLYILDTPDALLVANAQEAENVRSVVDALQQNGRSEASEAATVRRPWGSYTVLAEGEGYKVKRIEVLPQQKLSLQSHQHRSEHWTCVRGEMGVVVGEDDRRLQVGESCHIPLAAKHRMYNAGNALAVVIEVQNGDYLGEDDITRYEDIYGRVSDDS